MQRERQNLVTVLIGLGAIMMMGAGSPAVSVSDSRDKKIKEASEQSSRAAQAFESIMQVPDKAIPVDLLSKAKAVAVFPRVVKVAVTVGGQAGRGVVSRRTDEGWSSPVFLRGAGGSVGPQIGASATDYFLLLMNDESVDALMKDRFDLGGEAGVAAGPVGRNAGAATDAMMRAAILSYSRSHGLFAGLSLHGVVLQPEDDLNVAVYGRTARELLSEDDQAAVPDLRAFPRVLGRYTGDHE
jgi:lipid-binding SYLF domain-containing protein